MFLQEADVVIDDGYHRNTEFVFKSSFLQDGIDEKKFFGDCVQKIWSYTEGSNLLKKLNALFFAYEKANNRPLKFVVSFSGNPSCFGGKIEKTDTHDRVGINLNLIGSTFYHEEFGLCTTVPAISREIKGLCSICDCADPYWMLIAHEMIHMEHFLTEEMVKVFGKFFSEFKVAQLENDEGIKEKLRAGFTLFKDIFLNADCLLIDPIKAVYDCCSKYEEESPNFQQSIDVENLKKMRAELFIKGRYASNGTITPQEAKMRQELLDLLPELDSRKTSTSYLWNNLEERETVVGAKNSELVLRFEAKLPIRYIYQLKGKQFYESFETVRRIAEASGYSSAGNQLVNYINDPKKDSYFNARKFMHIIDKELLPDALFISFKFPQEASGSLSVSPPRKLQQKATQRPMMNVTKRGIVAAFDKDDLPYVVGAIYDSKTSAIKQEVKSALCSEKDGKAVIDEVESHLKAVSSPSKYKKEIIGKVVGILERQSRSVTKTTTSVKKKRKATNAVDAISFPTPSSNEQTPEAIEQIKV